MSGSVLSNAFGNEPAYFALKFTNGNGNGSYAAETELFRLVSFVVSGPGTVWNTVVSQQLDVHARSCTLAEQGVGKRKYVVTALYPDREASASIVKTVRATDPVRPTITLASAVGQTLSFEVANTSGFTYTFETQSNVLRGSDAREGNVVTYTFANSAASVGTHWVALMVIDSATGARARYVHVTNPPEDHPLCPYTEPTLEAAAARGCREGKAVCLLVTGEVDNDKFRNLSGFLTTNEIVSAVRDRYVFTELCVLSPGQLEVARRYWSSQPVTLGNTPASFSPATRAYAFLVDPRTSETPIPCTPNAYGTALNSQLDLVYPSVGIITVPKLISFLNQDFGLNLEPERDPEPSVEGGKECGTVVRNEAGEYVFMPPSAGALAVSISDVGTNVIVVPPGVLYVLGVPSAQIKVKHGTHDISPAFHLTHDTESGCVFLTLDENKSVVIGGGTVPVRPVLSPVGSGDLAMVPFAVGDSVSVGVRTIPGLKYTLLRGETPETLSEVPDLPGVVADGMRTQLKDENPPGEKAFYRVRVDVP